VFWKVKYNDAQFTQLSVLFVVAYAISDVNRHFLYPLQTNFLLYARSRGETIRKLTGLRITRDGRILRYVVKSACLIRGLSWVMNQWSSVPHTHTHTYIHIYWAIHTFKFIHLYSRMIGLDPWVHGSDRMGLGQQKWTMSNSGLIK